MLRADDLKREDERFGILFPVAYAFWTTSNFNKPARDYAKRMGLWCLGGLGLAQLAHKLKLLTPYTANTQSTSTAAP
jgi:hypothetical protein